MTRTVVIVGGGTAGWLSAGLIAARYRGAQDARLRVVLVESPTVATIGVGEGTWPTIRTTLKRIGVSETDFLRACDAAFKQASNFRGWVDGTDSYYHPFMVPKGFDTVNLAQAWARDPRGLSFDHAVAFQPQACERRLAPKRLDAPEFEGLATYAYHLDAGKFAGFLRDHCVEKLGVTHVRADMNRVEIDSEGYLAAIHCDGDLPVTGSRISGDLFIDCTGFSALLIGKHCGADILAVGDQLFIDSALAIQVPYVQADAPIASATVSTAQRAGWIWDIGLQTRRGTGHVYSSRFLSDDEALADLSAYVGRPLKEAEVRKIPIRSGFRDRPWIRNVAAVGLAMGFVEPLEASSIVMVELAAQMIADQMPNDRSAMAVVAKRYNDLFAYRWRRIVDFLKLHYVLSRRGEPFWVANRDPDTIPESLKDMLAVWRQRFPWHDDFTNKDEIFSDASYQYVLYGMGFKTQVPDWAYASFDGLAAERHRADVQRARDALDQLPGHRQLLTQLATQRLRG